LKASDLVGGKCQIDGMLGKPYGSIMKFTGVWEGSDRGKVFGNEEPFSLRITEVDGKKLAREHQVVTIHKCVRWLKNDPPFPHPLQGEKVEGRVYESGGYVIHPWDVERALDTPIADDAYDFEFYSFLYFIDYKSLGGAEEPARGPVTRPDGSQLPPQTPTRPKRSRVECFQALEVTDSAAKMKGVKVYLERKKEPSDHLLLAIVGPHDRSISHVKVELQMSGDVVLRIAPINEMVGPGEMLVRSVKLDREVIANPKDWEKYYTAKRLGRSPPVVPIPPFVPIKVSRLVATVK
jgi:hypothetical protein